MPIPQAGLGNNDSDWSPSVTSSDLGSIRRAHVQGKHPAFAIVRPASMLVLCHLCLDRVTFGPIPHLVDGRTL